MSDGIKTYFLGCPIWGNKDWLGSLFTSTARQPDYLKQYARVFNTVEGNNTFYGLPKPTAIERWREDIPENFRFSFKFPRKISHELALQYCQAETRAFFEAMAPLATNIGVYFLQLPPSFSPPALSLLDKFLAGLPQTFDYAVEVRHRAFFDDADASQRLNEILERHHVNRAIFDTGTLYNIKNASDPDVLEAQRKKPKMPAYFGVTANKPFLRYVGHKTVQENIPRLTEIAAIVAGWIGQGKQPYVFIHSPGDQLAPEIAREFHQLLKQELTAGMIGEVPAFPGDIERANTGEQMSLF